MKNKQPSVDLFATYAKNYNQYKKNTTSYQQKVEYIKSLYEVRRLLDILAWRFQRPFTRSKVKVTVTSKKKKKKKSDKLSFIQNCTRSRA
ncbi:hypothetical protein DPMN_059105 [Dreissena polymorpha]|uniref:Uncharacterized protein n=1 Tax=Dreissena polymorpha TaxID=45954 RepID=A0A9D4C3G5_DREPO|nr:hypothetical protein DPMN_059105 [Dreissena polymorpha]